jgi:hypothetical protein
MQLTSRDKKLIYVLAAALVLLFYLFVLKGGGGGETLTGPIGGVPPPIATPTVSPSPTPRETLPPVVRAGARDPVSVPPLFQTASAIPSGGVSPVPSGTGTTPPATTPPATTPPATTPPPTTPPPTKPPPTPGDQTHIGGHDVVLQDVFNEKTKARIAVDHRVWTVEVGATFDDSFELVSIDGTCASFLFGDQGFELCLRKS